ncbi:hypothetical protein SUDANB15_00695 [Streptomyces sp. enrichment culture]|uniref:STAS domain-containing protein n=1 Tax=Streptomyces sp. enrichment culture TaxID=1795815 RepID=UPI003F54456A
MSRSPDTRLHPVPRTATLTVSVAGEPDDVSGSELIDVVVAHLTGETPPREVRLDFRDLVRIGPPGLSALLVIHRHTSAARVTLRLDNRPGVLDRVLHRTDVLGHLTAAVAEGGAREEGRAATGGPARPASGDRRPTG